jgi:hypothetical protein
MGSFVSVNETLIVQPEAAVAEALVELLFGILVRIIFHYCEGAYEIEDNGFYRLHVYSLCVNDNSKDDKASEFLC